MAYSEEVIRINLMEKFLSIPRPKNNLPNHTKYDYVQFNAEHHTLTSSLGLF